VRTGRCLCGAVRYRVDGPLDPVVACHCTQCRRWTGHHAAATSARREHVTIDGTVAWYDSTPGVIRRGFCPACGSSLFWDRRSSDRLDLWAGSIDGPTGLTLVGHIYVADKGDYYTIPEGPPQVAGREPWPGAPEPA
jgi:hypothetical protein